MIGSVAGIRGCPATVAYQVVKGALPQLARALARDHGHEGIRVNVIEPGIIRTRFHQAMTPEAEKNNLDNRIPLRRFGKPEDVATAADRAPHQPVHHRRNPGHRRRHVDADRVRLKARPFAGARFVVFFPQNNSNPRGKDSPCSGCRTERSFSSSTGTRISGTPGRRTVATYGQTFIDTFFERHVGLTPVEQRWDMGALRLLRRRGRGQGSVRGRLLRHGDHDADLSSRLLFRRLQHHRAVRALKDASPDKVILDGRFDPRDGERGLDQLEEDHRALGLPQRQALHRRMERRLPAAIR